MVDTILLTGITGFVGGHTALAALNAGYRVRGSLRSLKKAEAVRATLEAEGANTDQLEFVELDLLSDEGWAEAAKGCRYLLHIASPYVLNAPKNANELIEPAVKGTERAINAGLAAGVERIVITSSMIAVMMGHPKSRTALFAEEDWSIFDRCGAYGQSKVLAEKRAWEMMIAADRRKDLVVVNPGNIMGPLLDNDAGTSGELIGRFIDGSTPATPHFALPVIDVRDLAEIEVKALTSDIAAGHRLLMGPESPSFHDVTVALREAIPERANKIPKRNAPDWLVRLLAMFDNSIRQNISELGAKRYADATLARKVLGHDFIPGLESYVEMGKSQVVRKLA